MRYGSHYMLKLRLYILYIYNANHIIFLKQKKEIKQTLLVEIKNVKACFIRNETK